MLTTSERQVSTDLRRKADGADRNPRRERRLWHDPDQATGSLGCAACPDRTVCGGLRLKIPFLDCLQFCCGKPDECDRVCRNNPYFADRVREVGTFALGTVPRAPLLSAPSLPRVVPVIYHRTARSTRATSESVALPLYRMFDRRTGMPRYSSRAALTKAFGISQTAAILLTGTDRDRPLERWWALGEASRRKIILAMKEAGIALVTTPNYSLFIDRPRWDDLHAMKRIAIVHEEFLREGLPAALHVNGRTEDDFRRWTAYVQERPEITHIAYEFTTGTGWAGRQELHAAWLADLAVNIGRPLYLVMRGGVEIVPILANAFAGITVLDTSIFMKTMMRQKAFPKSNSALGWVGSPTERGAPVDELFAENCRTVEVWLCDLIASSNDFGASIGR